MVKVGRDDIVYSTCKIIIWVDVGYVYMYEGIGDVIVVSERGERVKYK